MSVHRNSDLDTIYVAFETDIDEETPERHGRKAFLKVFFFWKVDQFDTEYENISK